MNIEKKLKVKLTASGMIALFALIQMVIGITSLLPIADGGMAVFLSLVLETVFSPALLVVAIIDIVFIAKILKNKKPIVWYMEKKSIVMGVLISVATLIFGTISFINGSVAVFMAAMGEGYGPFGKMYEAGVISMFLIPVASLLLMIFQIATTVILNKEK